MELVCGFQRRLSSELVCGCQRRLSLTNKRKGICMIFSDHDGSLLKQPPRAAAQSYEINSLHRCCKQLSSYTLKAIVPMTETENFAILCSV